MTTRTACDAVAKAREMIVMPIFHSLHFAYSHFIFHFSDSFLVSEPFARMNAEHILFTEQSFIKVCAMKI